MKARWMIAVFGLAIALGTVSEFADGSCDKYKCKPCTKHAGDIVTASSQTEADILCDSDPVHPVRGCELYTADAPGGDLWSITPTYNSMTGRWNTDADVRLNKVGTNFIQFIPDASVTMEFHRDNETAPWVAWGDALQPVQSTYVLATPDITGNITLYHNSPHSKTTYTFYGFPATPTDHDGRLISISIGDPSTSLQTVTYSYTNGVCTSVVDEHGRTITYQSITGSGSTYVVKVIESNPAAANPLNNTRGRVTWFVWEGGKLARMEIGMPKTANADPGVDASTPPVSADYYWRRTAYLYDTLARLIYVIPPEQYDAWLASIEPDRNDKYTVTKWTYAEGKVKNRSGTGCGCGGAVALGLEYAYLSPDNTKLYLGENAPGGVNAPVTQFNRYRWENGKKELMSVWQMNNNYQILFQLERATDNTGWLTCLQYTPSYYMLDNVSQYAVKFNWAEPGSAAYSYGDMFAAQKIEYDNQQRPIGQKRWDGGNYVDVERLTYVGNSKQLETQTWITGSDNLTTKYLYDNASRVICIAHPQVLGSQNSYDGSSYGVSYYLGERTFFDAFGRPTEERRVKLSDTPADWDNPCTDDAILASTNYYHVDNATTGCYELFRAVVDENGLNLVTRYEYAVVAGQWRKAAEIVDPDHLNLVTTYDYTTVNPEQGAWGNPTTITDPESAYKTVYDYDKAGRVLTQTRTCDGQVVSATKHQYCKYGKTCSTTEAAGFPEERSTVTEWDDVGRTKRVYTGVQNLQWKNGSWTGAVKGNVTEYCYITGTDRTSSVKQKAGWAACAPIVIASYAYRVDGKQLTVADALGHETHYAYSAFGNLDNVTNALSYITKYTYDLKGRQLTAAQFGDNNALLAKTESKFDAMDRVYQSIVYNPDNQTNTIITNFHHDPLGNQVKVTDPNGHSTEYTFDKAGRNTSVKDALGNYAYASYDRAGRVVESEQKMTSGLAIPRRELTINYFDKLGRTTASASWGANAPTGWSWTTEPVPWNYEKIPGSPGVSDDNHLVTAYAYGCDTTYGPYVCVTDPKSIQGFTYVDRLGRTTRSVESKDGIDRVTLFAYDQPVKGQGYGQDTITAKNDDTGGQITKYVRGDAADAGRVTETVYPDGGRVALGYNSDGTVKSRTDQRNWKTAFTYDPLGRAVEEDVARLSENDPPVTGTTQVTRTYDALGRVTQVFDNNGGDNGVTINASYSWAAASNQQTVVEKLIVGGVQMDNVTTLIDNGTLRTSLQYPNGRTLGFHYDALDRLDNITDTSGRLGEYYYKGYYLDRRDLNASTLRLTSDNGTALGGYDSFGRTTWMRHYKVASGDNTVILTYGYDYASNPLYQGDCVTSTNSELYSYDAAQRLIDMKRGTLNAQKTGVTNQSFGQTWTLDKLGNWRSLDDNGTADVRQHNEVNEISLPAGGQGQIRTYDGTPREVTHDAAGNVATCQTEDGTTTYKYTYDYRNRLIEVDNVASGNSIVMYLYDGQNRRVKKHLTVGTDVVYTHDGWQCIEERENISGSWKAKRQYVFASCYIDEPLLFDKDTDNNGQCNDVRYLYCQNANWNVVTLADSAGVAVERYAYEPYGGFAVTLDNASGNPYHFQGQRYDSETGLYYFKNRYYSPPLGRFMQRDPIGNTDGMNLYEYVQSRPNQHVDSQGLAAQPTPGKQCCARIVATQTNFHGSMELRGPKAETNPIYVHPKDTLAGGKGYPSKSEYAGVDLSQTAEKDENSPWTAELKVWTKPVPGYPAGWDIQLSADSLYTIEVKNLNCPSDKFRVTCTGDKTPGGKPGGAMFTCPQNETSFTIAKGAKRQLTGNALVAVNWVIAVSAPKREGFAKLVITVECLE